LSLPGLTLLAADFKSSPGFPPIFYFGNLKSQFPVHINLAF